MKTQKSCKKGLADNPKAPTKIMKDHAYKPANTKNIKAYVDNPANSHKQVLCIGIRPNGVHWKCCCDEQIADFITLLNDNGYVTQYSCCGESERCGGYISINYPTSYTKYARLIHLFKLRFRDKYVLLTNIALGRMRFAIVDQLTTRYITHNLVLISSPQQ